MTDAIVTDISEYRLAKYGIKYFHDWDDESLLLRYDLITQIENGEYEEGADPSTPWYAALFPYGRDSRTHPEDSVKALAAEVERRGLNDS